MPSPPLHLRYRCLYCGTHLNAYYPGPRRPTARCSWAICRSSTWTSSAPTCNGPQTVSDGLANKGSFGLTFPRQQAEARAHTHRQ